MYRVTKKNIEMKPANAISCVASAAASPLMRQAIVSEYIAFGRAPEIRDGNQLQPPTTATTVRVRDGEPVTTDGPFAATGEPLGGYYLVDADSVDAAIELAGRIPAARMGGAVEIRPVVMH
jgi:hypothetical protein